MQRLAHFPVTEVEWGSLCRVYMVKWSINDANCAQSALHGRYLAKHKYQVIRAKSSFGLISEHQHNIPCGFPRFVLLPGIANKFFMAQKKLLCQKYSQETFHFNNSLNKNFIYAQKWYYWNGFHLSENHETFPLRIPFCLHWNQCQEVKMARKSGKSVSPHISKFPPYTFWFNIKLFMPRVAAINFKIN